MNKVSIEKLIWRLLRTKPLQLVTKSNPSDCNVIPPRHMMEARIRDVKRKLRALESTEPVKKYLLLRRVLADLSRMNSAIVILERYEPQPVETKPEVDPLLLDSHDAYVPVVEENPTVMENLCFGNVTVKEEPVDSIESAEVPFQPNADSVVQTEQSEETPAIPQERSFLVCRRPGPASSYYRIFKCNICKRHLTSKVDCEVHMNTHAIVTTFQCRLCGQKFKQESDLTSHTRKHLGLPEFEHDICGFCNVFIAAHNQPSHSRQHVAGKRFACDSCERTFNTRAALDHHENVHKLLSGFDDFPMPNVELIAKNEPIDDFPMDSASDDPLDSVPVVNRQPESATYTRRIFICNICRRRFTSAEALEKHVETHANENDLFQCGICQRMCESELQLATHMQSHSGVQFPYVLPVTGDEDTQATDLERLNEAPTCDFLKEAFKVEAPEYDQNGICSICNEFIAIEDQLSHTLRHTEEKLFECELCEWTFNTQDELDQHACDSEVQERINFDGECMTVGEVAPGEDQNIDLEVKTELSDDCMMDAAFDDPLDIPASQSGESFSCEVCDWTFVSNEALEEHIETHMIEDVVPCEICGQIFETESQMMSHMETHSLEEPSVSMASPLRTSGDEESQNFDQHMEEASTSEEPHQLSSLMQTRSRLKKQQNLQKESISSGSDDEHLEPMDPPLNPAPTFDETGKCSMCGKCIDSCKRKVHERQHTGERPVPCKLCDKKCISKTAMRLHMVKWHDFSALKAVADTKVDKRLRFLARKKSSILKRGTATFDANGVCSLCGKHLSIWQRSLHIQRHAGKRPFSCKLCKRRFLTNAHLKYHIGRHALAGANVEGLLPIANQGKLQLGTPTYDQNGRCSLCDKMILSTFDQERHTRRHGGIKPFVCPICSVKFKTKSELVVHVKRHDKNIDIAKISILEPGTPTYDENGVCSICQMVVRVGAKRKAHTGLHTGEKPFACEFCGLKFDMQLNLNRHVKEHELSYDKSGKCSVCEAHVPRGPKRHAHTRNHYFEERFSCDKCKFVGKSSDELKRHVESRHVRTVGSIKCGVPTYSNGVCSLCGIFVKHPKAHSRRHLVATRTKNTCLVCGKEFINLDFLEKHMETHGGREGVEARRSTDVVDGQGDDDFHTSESDLPSTSDHFIIEIKQE